MCKFLLVNKDELKYRHSHAYLNKRVELVYFEAGIFLLLVVEQIGHYRLVVLYVFA